MSSTDHVTTNSDNAVGVNVTVVDCMGYSIISIAIDDRVHDESELPPTLIAYLSR